MNKKEPKAGRRAFTVELNSRSNLKDMAVPNGSQKVVIGGTIGALRRAEFVEDSVLEVIGTGGVLRVDLAKEDLAAFKNSGAKPN